MARSCNTTACRVDRSAPCRGRAGRLAWPHHHPIGVHRGRHAAEFRDGALADLALLPIQIDPETDRQAWGVTARLAERHCLTLYDAAYLELALRRALPLATLDRELRAAAENQSVQLLGA
jgi:predicted nucleic acid-binding protein